VISLRDLAELYDRHRDDVETKVGALVLGDRVYDVDARPVIMGCVNLSRASTYRESIAVNADSAVRKARVMVAEGADLVDLGAESSTAAAPRVDGSDQLELLLPVVRPLVADGIAVSIETYRPEVARACLEAGAAMINFTGAARESEIYDLVAEHCATLVLCRVSGDDVRQITDVGLGGDPAPGLLEHFTERVERARDRGVERIVIDPGMGFYYGDLVDPLTRVRHQAGVLLGTMQLRRLGLPICHALPHAFDLFEDQFRSAEGFFAVLAALGGTGVYRTHEVPQVRAVLGALRALDVDPYSEG
jgi:dihydropteroate synthase